MILHKNGYFVSNLNAKYKNMIPMSLWLIHLKLISLE